MRRRDWAPETIERPSVAHGYDHHLGGWHHVAASRTAAQAMVDVVPEVPPSRAGDDGRSAEDAERTVLLRGVGRLGG
ncbi:hypothetical protein ACIBTV_08050 [Micromonospora sp. NPDC049366]|uniref:hypothetical protein n=1 Tax=Micromonospora sp. NPDC049366 TaxID=3364271 RepID=UPI0037ABF7FD